MMQTTVITRVKAGKIIKPKPFKIIQTPKSTFVRRLISRLNSAIHRDAHLLVIFRRRGQLTPRLELLIEDYYREVVSVIKSFPLTGNRISKVFNSQIHKLEKVNEQFVSNFQRELLGMGAHRKRVEFVLSWLTEDIKYFVNEFNATYSSIPVEFSEHGEIMPPSWIHIPNRSADQKRKKKFKEFIESCKESDGSLKKYPRHKTVQLFMNRAGFEFPDRTYRLYKQQIKNGTFDNFIQ